VGFSVGAAGVYKVAIDRVSGVFEDANESVNIFLKDKSLNVVHDLRQSPYSFTADVAGNFTDRFELVYQSNALGTNDSDATQTFAFISNNMLQVQSLNALKNIEVYDITGKQVNSYKLNTGETRFSADFTNADGFYMAKITLIDGTVVTRKMVTN
ncbi:MAG: T9SS type A sorting domain-containing protein, partial [Chitinophagaceae bacterium]